MDGAELPRSPMAALAEDTGGPELQRWRASVGKLACGLGILYVATVAVGSWYLHTMAGGWPDLSELALGLALPGAVGGLALLAWALATDDQRVPGVAWLRRGIGMVLTVVLCYAFWDGIGTSQWTELLFGASAALATATMVLLPARVCRGKAGAIWTAALYSGATAMLGVEVLDALRFLRGDPVLIALVALLLLPPLVGAGLLVAMVARRPRARG